MVHGAIELRGHGVEVIGPGGKDEEGAFGTGEEALSLGLAGDGFLLEMDEREALFDGDVLDGEFAGGDTGRDEHGALLGILDPGVTFVLPCLGVGVRDVGTRIGWVGKGMDGDGRGSWMNGDWCDWMQMNGGWMC